jgi:hypothetical protein
MNWNTSTLTPASAMHATFRRKSVFSKYPAGWPAEIGDSGSQDV